MPDPKKGSAKKVKQSNDASTVSDNSSSGNRSYSVLTSAETINKNEEDIDTTTGTSGAFKIDSTKLHVDRDEYLAVHRDLVYDLRQLQLKNNILHRRLAEYFRKRKLTHVLKPIDNSSELEEKYQQKLFVYEEMKEKEEREIVEIKNKLDVVEAQYNNRYENASETFANLQQLERSTGIGLIFSKKGKPIADKTVEYYLKMQRTKNDQCCALRLRYIRARNAVAEVEAIVRELEMIGPGLSVADFEQLSIDHQNYLNKIEEREDELIKNRTKCSEQNQILAHIREKMHHTDEVIDHTECDLGDAEMEYHRAREYLGEVKSRRDKLRWCLQEEGVRAGLLTKKDLLRDFQDAVDRVAELKQRKEKLTQQIKLTQHHLRGVRACMQMYSKSSKTSNNSVNLSH